MVQDVADYKAETEELLRAKFGAVHVLCYELRTRKNVSLDPTQFDVNDPLLIGTSERGSQLCDLLLGPKYHLPISVCPRKREVSKAGLSYQNHQVCLSYAQYSIMGYADNLLVLGGR